MTTRPIDLQLSDKTKLLLEKLKKHGKYISLKNSMRVIGMSYRKEVKGIFERKQTRDASLRWAKLAPSTLKEKARLGYGNKNILERTGKLKRSMSEAGAEGNINKYGNHFGQFGSTIKYGLYHDNLDAPRTKIPMRNFSQPSLSTYGSWLETINSDINSQLKRQGIYSE